MTVVEGTYYTLSSEQVAYLRTVVEGRTVADLGCGSGTLAVTMADMGAKLVHAVDKAPCPVEHPRIEHHQSYFKHWSCPEGVEVAVVCWPQNYTLMGLTEVLHAVPNVVYVGKNTDGTACGTPPLFAYLSRREPLRCLPRQTNVLIHYGNEPRREPTLYHEEFAALWNDHPHPYLPSDVRQDVSSWLQPSTRA